MNLVTFVTPRRHCLSGNSRYNHWHDLNLALIELINLFGLAGRWRPSLDSLIGIGIVLKFGGFSWLKSVYSWLVLECWNVWYRDWLLVHTVVLQFRVRYCPGDCVFILVVVDVAETTLAIVSECWGWRADKIKRFRRPSKILNCTLFLAFNCWYLNLRLAIKIHHGFRSLLICCGNESLLVIISVISDGIYWLLVLLPGELTVLWLVLLLFTLDKLFKFFLGVPIGRFRVTASELLLSYILAHEKPLCHDGRFFKGYPVDFYHVWANFHLGLGFQSNM
jgi:hypothetical protein